MNDLINEMAPVFALATTGFDAFYKEAEDRSSGTNSQSAASGKYSQSASSGNYSQSAASGDYSQSASSGGGSQSASSGTDSKSAASGNYSQSASSGYNSKSAASGKYSQSASSGTNSKSAASGGGSQSASSGGGSQSASSGTDSKSAASGNYSQSAASGYNSKSASSGDYSQSASSGNWAACSALGYRAAVRGDLGNLLMASEYLDNKPVGGLAALVDGKTLKPQCWYIVEKGAWVEVDLTDGVFAYVLKTTKGVKKVRTDNGDILYIVGDDQGNFSHGKTIKEARADLVYKVTAKFDGILPESATGAEWVAIYRAATGACAAGCRSFVESKQLDLTATYTKARVKELTAGQYGSEKLKGAA